MGIYADVQDKIQQAMRDFILEEARGLLDPADEAPEEYARGVVELVIRLSGYTHERVNTNGVRLALGLEPLS